MVHCEDGSIVEAAIRRLVGARRSALSDYSASRLSQPRSLQRRRRPRSARAPALGYVEHLSSARALEMCQQARLAGSLLFVETRPLYLHLTEERMAGPDGPLFVGQPPLRAATDIRELWRVLVDGRIDVVGADPHPTRAPRRSCAVVVQQSCPRATAFRLPMYFAEGVRKRKLPLTRFVATTSTNAAASTACTREKDDSHFYAISHLRSPLALRPSTGIGRAASGAASRDAATCGYQGASPADPTVEHLTVPSGLTAFDMLPFRSQVR